MYGVISYSKQWFHPLLALCYTHYYHHFTDALRSWVNFPMDAQSINGKARFSNPNQLNSNSAPVSIMHCLPFYGKISMTFSGKPQDQPMNNKNSCRVPQQLLYCWIISKPTPNPITKIYLLLISPFPLPHRPYQHMVLQNSSPMPSFQELPFMALFNLFSNEDPLLLHEHITSMPLLSLMLMAKTFSDPQLF